MAEKQPLLVFGIGNRCILHIVGYFFIMPRPRDCMWEGINGIEQTQEADLRIICFVAHTVWARNRNPNPIFFEFPRYFVRDSCSSTKTDEIEYSYSVSIILLNLLYHCVSDFGGTCSRRIP